MEIFESRFVPRLKEIVRKTLGPVGANADVLSVLLPGENDEAA